MIRVLTMILLAKSAENSQKIAYARSARFAAITEIRNVIRNMV